MKLWHDDIRTFETGQDLARWMVDNDHVPPRVTIHSWSPPGARAMAATLMESDCDVIIRPYEHLR